MIESLIEKQSFRRTNHEKHRMTPEELDEIKKKKAFF